MEYTKEQVRERIYNVRYSYHRGLLSSAEIKQYETLLGWYWGRTLSKSFVSYKEAKQTVKKIGFKNSKEYKAWKKPEGMPCAPHVTYADSGWSGWGEFLGTGSIQPERFMTYLTLAELKVLLKAEGVKSYKGYRAWSVKWNSGRKILGAPKNPNLMYANTGWLGFDDLYDTNNDTTVRSNSFLTFEDARTFVRSLKLIKSCAGWVEYCKSGKRPSDIPSAPWEMYKTEWVSMPNWAGYEVTFVHVQKKGAMHQYQYLLHCQTT
jgi:hypothetical protein